MNVSPSTQYRKMRPAPTDYDNLPPVIRFMRMISTQEIKMKRPVARLRQEPPATTVQVDRSLSQVFVLHSRARASFGLSVHTGTRIEVVVGGRRGTANDRMNAR